MEINRRVTAGEGDKRSCPRAMRGEFGLLSPGKASSHSTALPSLSTHPHPPPPPPPLFCVHCFRASIPPAGMLTLLRQMDMGSLTHSQIWVRAVHTKGGGSGTNKSAQELTWSYRRRKQLLLTLPRQGIDPRVFG